MVSRRRLPALVAALVAIAALVVVARTDVPPTTVSFGGPAAPWLPAVTSDAPLTSTWFCPGVPATGEEGVGGEVVIANRRSDTMTVRVGLIGEDGTAASRELTVEPGDIGTVDVAAALAGTFVSAVVEIDGGGAIVEQIARHPAGTAVSPCATDTSPTWYLADGFTVDGSRNQVVLTNPFDDPVIVDIGFATAEGSRTPAAYQGFPVAPRSVEIIDFGVAGAGAQGEERLAIAVTATRGRLVVGRSQHFVGGGRLGYTMTLGAPAVRDQWWFAEGEKSPTASERFSIYNPTDTDVEVDVVFLGVSELAEVDPIPVPARQVVTFEPGTVPTLVEGPHATVFATRSEPAIVVERALTRTVDGRPLTSVLPGAPPRPDGFVPNAWFIGIGPEEPTERGLVVFNVDNAPGAVTVAVVEGGVTEPIPALTDLEIGTASVLAIDLPAEAVGRPLLITSTTRVFVERSLPSGVGGRSTAWALPAV